MQGASLVQLDELELGDQVKVVHEDGSFEATIAEVNQDGIVFKLVSNGQNYIMDIMDIPEFDFYPRGATIMDIQLRNSEPAQIPNQPKEVVSKISEIIPIKVEDLKIGIYIEAHSSINKYKGEVNSITEAGIFITTSSGTRLISFMNTHDFKFFTKDKSRGLEESKIPEINDDTMMFFDIFQRYQELPIGDDEADKATAMVQTMQKLSEGKPDLEEAFTFIVNSRIDKATARLIEASEKKQANLSRI